MPFSLCCPWFSLWCYLTFKWNCLKRLSFGRGGVLSSILMIVLLHISNLSWRYLEVFASVSGIWMGQNKLNLTKTDWLFVQQLCGGWAALLLVLSGWHFSWKWRCTTWGKSASEFTASSRSSATGASVQLAGPLILALFGMAGSGNNYLFSKLFPDWITILSSICDYFEDYLQKNAAVSILMSASQFRNMTSSLQVLHF